MGFGVSMERAVLVRGRIRRVGDPVVHWLGRVGPRSRPTYGAAFRLFMRWLSGRTSWLGVDASGLLVRQAEAEDPYELLDLLQEFVSGLDRGAKSKQLVYAAVKSFFMHNRCALPDDRGFRIRGTKPPVVPRLSLNDVSNLVRAAGLRSVEADPPVLLQLFDGCDQSFSNPVEFAADRRPAPKGHLSKTCRVYYRLKRLEAFFRAKEGPREKFCRPQRTPTENSEVAG